MPNALPRLAEPDEHRIRSPIFSPPQKGRHTFKFGGDANIVHEVMINLYQGGGLYSYSGTPLQAFQTGQWMLSADRPGTQTTRGHALYHLRADHRCDQSRLAVPAPDDFYMQMYDGFAEDSWKITPQPGLEPGRAL